MNLQYYVITKLFDESSAKSNRVIKEGKKHVEHFKELQLNNAYAENGKWSAEKIIKLAEINRFAVYRKELARNIQLNANNIALFAEEMVLHADPFAEEAKQFAENAKKCVEEIERSAMEAQRLYEDICDKI